MFGHMDYYDNDDMKSKANKIDRGIFYAKYASKKCGDGEYFHLS